MALVWLNGWFERAETARIDPADRGFLLGEGAFETLRFEDGAIRRWPAHRARLAGALERLAFPAPDWDAIPEIAADLVGAHALTEAVVRLTLARGAAGPGLAPKPDIASTVLMTAAPLLPPPICVALHTVDHPRRCPQSLSARFKLTAYADNLDARRQALAAGVDMAVMRGAGGALACADSASLFWVKGDRLFTPALETGALPGTARAAILQAAAAAGAPIEAGAWPVEALHTAEAVFIVNAVMGVVAARSIDGRALDPAHRALDALRAFEAERP